MSGILPGVALSPTSWEFNSFLLLDWLPTKARESSQYCCITQKLEEEEKDSYHAKGYLCKCELDLILNSARRFYILTDNEELSRITLQMNWLLVYKYLSRLVCDNFAIFVNWCSYYVISHTDAYEWLKHLLALYTILTQFRCICAIKI